MEAKDAEDVEQDTAGDKKPPFSPLDMKKVAKEAFDDMKEVVQYESNSDDSSCDFFED